MSKNSAEGSGIGFDRAEGRTTRFSNGAGHADSMPGNAVMPAPSAATADSAPKPRMYPNANEARCARAALLARTWTRRVNVLPTKSPGSGPRPRSQRRYDPSRSAMSFSTLNVSSPVPDGRPTCGNLKPSVPDAVSRFVEALQDAGSAKQIEAGQKMEEDSDCVANLERRPQ